MRLIKKSLLCLLSTTFLYQGYSFSASEPGTSFWQETDMTYLVLQRFYIIARLEKMCTSFFATAVDNRTRIASFFPSFIQPVFTITTQPAVLVLADVFPLLQHEHIRSHVKVALGTSSLEPIHKLWKEVCAYRFLGDDLFTQEFSRIFYTLLSSSLTHHKSQTIDMHSLTPADALAITQRFYVIQRLQKAIALCIEEHNASKDPALTVMFALWDDIQHYKNIDKISVSLGICSSIIAFLADRISGLPPSITVTHHEKSESTQAHIPRVNTSAPYPDTGMDDVDQAALEKLLGYIDAITDRYNYEKNSKQSS